MQLLILRGHFQILHSLCTPSIIDIKSAQCHFQCVIPANTSKMYKLWIHGLITLHSQVCLVCILLPNIAYRVTWQLYIAQSLLTSDCSKEESPSAACLSTL